MKKVKWLLPALGLSAAALVKYRQPLGRFVLGNLPVYAPGAQTLDPASPLYGKRVVFLGSSITYGAMSLGQSFVDDLAAADGVIATKLAISGTTLAGPDKTSYIARLLAFHPTQTPDAFVCQLSTNDGRQGKALGEIRAAGPYDTTTTMGAILAIIAFVQANWHCPIVFYTCVRRPGRDYDRLVSALHRLQAQSDFAILDLHGDAALASATAAHPAAMFDDAHPTQLGYAKLWTPLFRAQLIKTLAVGGNASS